MRAGVSRAFVMVGKSVLWIWYGKNERINRFKQLKSQTEFFKLGENVFR